MRHAIEEEEKVPMEQVTNFQEVTLWRCSHACGLVPSHVACRAPTVCWCLGPETGDSVVTVDARLPGWESFTGSENVGGLSPRIQ